MKRLFSDEDVAENWGNNGKGQTNMGAVTKFPAISQWTMATVSRAKSDTSTNLVGDYSPRTQLSFLSSEGGLMPTFSLGNTKTEEPIKREGQIDNSSRPLEILA